MGNFNRVAEFIKRSRAEAAQESDPWAPSARMILVVATVLEVAAYVALPLVVASGLLQSLHFWRLAVQNGQSWMGPLLMASQTALPALSCLALAVLARAVRWGVRCLQRIARATEIKGGST